MRQQRNPGLDTEITDAPRTCHRCIDDLLDRWVAEQAGGLIVVAGPVYTPVWANMARGDRRIILNLPDDMISVQEAVRQLEDCMKQVNEGRDV